MTTLQLTVDLPDSIAREAAEAGLLTPRALAKMLRTQVRRRAVKRLLTGGRRATTAGSEPLSMMELQAIVDEVRREGDAGERIAAG